MTDEVKRSRLGMSRYRSSKHARPKPPRSHSSNGLWVLAGCSSAIIGAFAFTLSRDPTTPSATKEVGVPSAPLEMSREPSIAQAPPKPTPPVKSQFQICVAVRDNCVVDGDTMWLAGAKIRIADIDAPEVTDPKCDYEKQLGDRATFRLLELLNAGPFEVQTSGDRQTDKYGRDLRILVRDGQSLGQQLVDEGLARDWTGRREPWC